MYMVIGADETREMGFLLLLLWFYFNYQIAGMT